MKNNLSAVQGSLIGGAIGDALGYPVEFMRREQILARYGEKGIQDYELDPECGLAVVSDDTQMTLFTLNGLLIRDTRGKMRGIAAMPQSYINTCYCKGWYYTQTGEKPDENVCCLMDIPELWARRAPGGTCLTALESGGAGSVSDRINHSKGCGGVMRVSPVALYYGRQESLDELEKIDLIGAEVAALTHGHPLGFMPAAALTHILSRAAFGGCTCGDDLVSIVQECKESMKRLFSDEYCLTELLEIMDLAVEKSQSDWEDYRCIRSIGEGWVGEEAFGIALYCALRYPNDFTRAVTSAVNHSGDSDSTGAIAGNILGAWLGMEGIDPKWLCKLEMKDLILEMAQDLHTGCPMSAYSDAYDARWHQKYVMHHWPKD